MDRYLIVASTQEMVDYIAREHEDVGFKWATAIIGRVPTIDELRGKWVSFREPGLIPWHHLCFADRFFPDHTEKP